MTRRRDVSSCIIGLMGMTSGHVTFGIGHMTRWLDISSGHVTGYCKAIKSGGRVEINVRN